MAETATQASQPTTTRASAAVADAVVETTTETRLTRYSNLSEVRAWLVRRNFPHFIVRGQACVRFALAPPRGVTTYLRENAFYYDPDAMTWLHDCGTILTETGLVVRVLPAMMRAAIRKYRARVDALADYEVGLREGCCLRPRRTSLYSEIRAFEDAEEAAQNALDALDAASDAKHNATLSDSGAIEG